MIFNSSKLKSGLINIDVRLMDTVNGNIISERSSLEQLAPRRLSPEVDALVVPVLPAAHVAVVADDLAQVFRRHLLLLRVHKAEFALLRVPLALQLLPFPRLQTGA